MKSIYALIVHWTIHRRRLLLAMIIAMTIVLGFFAARIQIKLNFKDLLGGDQKVMNEYDRMIANYPYSSSVFVVLQGDDPQQLVNVGDKLATELLKDEEWVQDVQWREQMGFFRSNSLILQSEDDLKEMREHLQEHPQMLYQAFRGFNISDFLSGMNAGLADYDSSSNVKQDEDDLISSMDNYGRFFSTLQQAMAGKTREFAVRRSLTDVLTDPEDDSIYRYIDDEGHMISPDGTTALMQIISKGDANEYDYAIGLTAHLRQVIAAVEENSPGVDIGLTGFPVLGSDEGEAVMDNMAIGFIVAIAGILLLFFIGFRQILMPTLAAIPLIVGIVWSMGIASLTIGELNMFSMMAPVILLGLGIDYAIHIISKYTESRSAGMTIEQALQDVFRRIGHGLTIGALTTAAAFFAITAAGFKGMNDFGVIGGISVLGAFTAMVVILPLLLTAIDRRWSRKGKKVTDISFPFIGRVVKMSGRLRYLVLAALVLLIVLAGFSATNLRIEKDILKIEPKGLESIELQQRILDKFNFSIYTSYAMMDSLDEVYEASDRLKDMSTVKRTESLATILPNSNQQSKRREIIAEIAPFIRELDPAEESNVDKEILIDEINELGVNLYQLKTLSYMAGLTRLVSSIEQIEGQVNDLADHVKTADIEALREVNDFVNAKLELEYQSLQRSLSHLSIDRQDVPEVYLDRYQGQDGSYLLTVYPSEYVWTAEFTDKHLSELNSILTNPTGMIPIWGDVLAGMTSGMLRATGAALAALTLLLLIDFRSLRRVVAILVPLLLALLLTLALLPILGMKLNIVSMMAFPLILGIGIDDAVHLYHRYLVERDIRRAFLSTGKAITMTTLTTIMAMMSLVLSSHPGMISFAWVASIGIALCLVLDLLVLPALIDLFEKNRKEK